MVGSYISYTAEQLYGTIFQPRSFNLRKSWCIL